MNRLIIASLLSLFVLAGCQGADFAPESCVTSPEFSCEEYSLTATADGATLNFALSNNLGNTLRMQNATATQGALTADCQPDTQSINAGEQATYTCQFSQAPEAMQAISIDGTYQQAGGRFARTFTADIEASIQ